MGRPAVPLLERAAVLLDADSYIKGVRMKRQLKALRRYASGAGLMVCWLPLGPASAANVIGGLLTPLVACRARSRRSRDDRRLRFRPIGMVHLALAGDVIILTLVARLILSPRRGVDRRGRTRMHRAARAATVSTPLSPGTMAVRRW